MMLRATGNIYSRFPVVLVQSPTLFRFQRYPVCLASFMSTQRDVSHLSDITQMKTEHDGSFKRAPSSFRNFIEKGGRFEPEKGLYLVVSPALRKQG